MMIRQWAPAARHLTALGGIAFWRAAALAAVEAVPARLFALLGVGR